MREAVDAAKVRSFMRALGQRARTPARVYLVGGSSAVVEGWRPTTIDLDLRAVPDHEVLSQLPGLKEELRISVETADPTQFLPALPGWEERSRFVAQEGKITFLHFDWYSQALAKIERGFERDLADVREMLSRRLIDPRELLRLFEAIEADLVRFPAVDPKGLRRSVEDIAAGRT